MRKAWTTLLVLLALQHVGAQEWRTPVAVDIPAKFDINLRGVPSRCYSVVRPADGRISAKVIGPGSWNICVGDSNCPYDCMSGGRREVSTEPLTTGSHYYVMVERSGTDAMASLEIFATAKGRPAFNRPALPTVWTAVVPKANFRRGGYKITQDGDQLTLVNWGGKATSARYKDDFTIVAEAGDLAGTISADRKRIDWSNGSYWVAAAATGPCVAAVGAWTAVVPQKNFRRGGYKITQDGAQLTLVAWDGKATSASCEDGVTIVSEGGKVTGRIGADGKRIEWSNGSYWVR
jgi:hypothetical protein